MKKSFCVIVVLIFATSIFNTTEAHKRAKFNVIIDTDAGVDDLMALTVFMASKDFNINAITSVDGVLPADEAADYISSLATLYNHEGIPIGEGGSNETSKKYYKHAIPVWISLFPNVIDESFESSISVIEKAIRNENGNTIIVALGPLTNVSGFVNKYPDLIPKIDHIVWYCSFDKEPSGFNFTQDIGAFKKLQENGIPIKLISSNEVKYEDDFFEACTDINTNYSNALVTAFSLRDNKQQPLFYWDNLLPLYLIYPNLFDEHINEAHVNIVTPKSDNYFDVLLSAILNSDQAGEGVVFNEIPTSGFMLRSDVSTSASEIIEAHGYPEFKIASLTSEIHSHMGIYSILGAKMGLRIMEYFHAGLDEINIVSYAGTNPPISCLNDGLQVGTGSTIGYGTIQIDTTDIKPSVLVRYNNREVMFSIKPELLQQIRADVGKLISSYGLESELYWIKLRELSIKKYWLGVSRYDAFDIEEL